MLLKRYFSVLCAADYFSSLRPYSLGQCSVCFFLILTSDYPFNIYYQTFLIIMFLNTDIRKIYMLEITEGAIKTNNPAKLATNSMHLVSDSGNTKDKKRQE